MTNQKKWEEIKDVLEPNVKEVITILITSMEKDITPEVVFKVLSSFYSKEVVEKALKFLLIFSKSLSKPDEEYIKEKFEEVEKV